MPLLILWLVCWLPAGTFSASAEGPAPSDAPAAATSFQPGQIWEAQGGRLIPFDELMARLAPLDVIYLGEEHHNARHVDAAVKVLLALLSQGRRPTLALEMFSWDGQPALDRYLADRDQARDQFLKEIHWEQMWGGPFEDYEPLVTLARTQGLSLLALNPPKTLVRLVARQGLARAMADQEMARWGMKDAVLSEDPAYREMIVKPLRQCHGGLSDDAYQRMYEASMFRDEGMAMTIAGLLRRGPSGSNGGEPSLAPAPARQGPIVSYTGGGHIQYQLPVPQRVRRRDGAVRQASIYLTSFEPDRTDEIRSLMQGGVADFLWLTPLSAHGAPRRCR